MILWYQSLSEPTHAL